MLTDDQGQAAAYAILAAERARVPCVQPSRHLPDMGLEDAFNVQHRWAEARMALDAITPVARSA